MSKVKVVICEIRSKEYEAPEGDFGKKKKINRLNVVSIWKEILIKRQSLEAGEEKNWICWHTAEFK